MVKKVENYILHHQLLEKGENVVVGVSGGGDSVCLLHILHKMKKEWELQLNVVHVHHGLRGEEADRDRAYVEELCRELGIDCYTYYLDVRREALDRKLSIEQAGREIRYECFEEVLVKTNGHKIAVAHHQNDNAETVLLNMFRGTGLRGMTGIAPRRDRIVRPLLCCLREEIEEYLLQNKIKYCQDSTNVENEYTRNKIRNHILHYAKQEINLQAEAHIHNLTLQLSQVQDYIVQEARIILTRYGKYSDGYELDMKCVECHEVIQSAVIREVLFQMTDNLKDMEEIHIKQVMLLFGRQVGKRIELPCDLEAIKTYTGVTLRKQKKDNSVSAEYEKRLKIPCECSIPDAHIHVKTRLFNFEKTMIIEKNDYTKWFDYDKIKNSLSIRNRRTGDFIYLKGLSGYKKISRYMLDEKIPVCLRSSIPLIADGHHIMWIIGYRMSEAYQITETTKTVLEIQIVKNVGG